MKSFGWMLIVFLSLFVTEDAGARTFPLSLRYQPAKELSSLSQKVGPVLSLAPFKDERKETLFIGRYTPFLGVSSYFKSNPFPLEKAMMEALSLALSRQGIKTVPVQPWDGKPEVLKGLETDSILMIEIKKFWTEGDAYLFRSRLTIEVHFVIHLGVKREGKVFSRNVEVEREFTATRLTSERMEQTVNQTLTDIFDAFFSNPYDI